VTVLPAADLADAIEAGTVPTDAPGPLIVDATTDRSPAALLAALKVLAELGRAGRRTIAVVGAVDGADWEEHDRIGRIVVRLDIRLLVVVGEDARHLYSAAGLEGSWDGEARLVTTPAEAYDGVRDGVDGNSAVLVTVPDVLEILRREVAA
jgi:UDP-N-acetylmuramoyl-tripeptide--D-alanyl-D-alanine ligase